MKIFIFGLAVVTLVLQGVILKIKQHTPSRLKRKTKTLRLKFKADLKIIHN
jgi:hypothetical protein